MPRGLITQPNWLVDGALMLGIASYAIIDGGEALVYDTHLSVDRARWICSQLDAARSTVVLSHRHIDHIAGTEAFADCEVLAGSLTELVGEIAQYEDVYRLCFLRNPEGIIIGLAEQLG